MGRVLKAAYKGTTNSGFARPTGVAECSPIACFIAAKADTLWSTSYVLTHGPVYSYFVLLLSPSGELHECLSLRRAVSP